MFMLFLFYNFSSNCSAYIHIPFRVSTYIVAMSYFEALAFLGFADGDLSIWQDLQCRTRHEATENMLIIQKSS